MTMAQYATGYNIEDENLASLMAGAQPSNQYSFGTIDPKTLKPIGLIDVVNVENQQKLSACAGHAFTTIAEVCIWHQTNGRRLPQLSRMFAYVEGQKKNGIVGDRGAVLEGVIAASKEKGTCEEQFAPYTGNYYTGFAVEAYTNAQQYKLKSYSPCQTLQDAYEGIGRRIGGLFFGIPCTQEIFNLPSSGRLEYYNAVRAGGHALCIVDTCEERDENGNPYFLGVGSWSKNYGYRGFMKIRPSAFQSMLQCSLTSCFFLSDMEIIKPRYDWESQKWLA